MIVALKEIRKDLLCPTEIKISTIDQDFKEDGSTTTTWTEWILRAEDSTEEDAQEAGEKITTDLMIADAALCAGPDLVPGIIGKIFLRLKFILINRLFCINF